MDPDASQEMDLIFHNTSDFGFHDKRMTMEDAHHKKLD